MTKIRVLVDAHSFDDTFQGTTSYIQSLYSELVKNPDFEITLASAFPDNLRLIFNDDRFNFIRIPAGPAWKRLFFSFPALLRRHSFDFAHFQYVVPFSKQVRFINTIHDVLFLDFPGHFPWIYRTARHIGFRYGAKHAALVCTVSAYSKKALQRHFRLSESKLLLTPNTVTKRTGTGADVKRKHGLGKYFLYVSRFEPRKNHLLLLEAFVDGFYREFQLVFIGRRKDVYNQRYEIYFNRLPAEIKARILHLENVSPDELQCFYEQASLFIYPSLAEGFGIPPLEAAMAGCKVVCSGATAMEDFDFFRPYLFDPLDLTELKAKIRLALSDTSYDAGRIREAVLKKYDGQATADRFAEKLKSLFKTFHDSNRA